MALIRPEIFYHRFSSYLELKSNMFIPSVQRDLVESHIDSMRQHIKDSIKAKKEPIFGTIDLVNLDGKYYLVDGQHRYNAIEKEYIQNETIVPIHALIYPVSNEEEMEEVFKIRNKGIPVPSFILSVKETKKELLKKINKFLEKEHSEIFKYDKFVRPYININTFIECFRMTKIYSLIETFEEFQKVFNLMNQECYSKIYTMTEKSKKKYGISDRMLSFWSENNIFLGYSKDFDFMSELNITAYENMLKK